MSPEKIFTETIFTNARIVTADGIVAGSLKVANGVIAGLDDTPSALGHAVDCEGDYLLPGLVELHTDNLEKHFTPRPGVRWPPLAAVVGHDAQIAAAGITTVFDAVSIGDIMTDSERLANLDAMVSVIIAAREDGILRADHRLHLRCEVSHPETAGLYRALSEHPLVELVSVMDHTPGQRQFVILEKYRDYYQKRHNLSDEAFVAFTQRRVDDHHRHSGPNRRAIVALARERGHRLASHDDATLDHVAEAVADGVSIAEFPTTVAAALASRNGGLAVLMGAPNVVRGGSHSGNVSALSLAADGLLDILSSDYVPGALIQAAFQLTGDAGIALPDAIAKVAENPARAVGLDDRGRIAPGLRADLVRAREVRGETGPMPIVRGVWRAGERVI
jgi:alpha-D-ribose 1-methylphosphonate 5-triphosphate diphosphatase